MSATRQAPAEQGLFAVPSRQHEAAGRSPNPPLQTLTPRQSQILSYICETTRTLGLQPSISEICTAVGLASTSSVAHHLKRLTAMGLLVHDPSHRRKYRVPAHADVSQDGPVTKATSPSRTELSGLDPKQARQADSVYHRLREAILAGEIPPGAALEPAVLATGYKAGGEVICAALKRLVRDGLTEDTASSDRRSGAGTLTSKPPRCSGAQGARYYSAFGVTRTLSQWVRDPRCRVNLGRLYYRIHNSGWSVEEALTTPLTSGY